jgi:hypothetical protein
MPNSRRLKTLSPSNTATIFGLLLAEKQKELIKREEHISISRLSV